MSDQPIYVNNNLFVGRPDEQERFHQMLRKFAYEWTEADPPRIILLHGDGGMGKTTLAARFYDIAMIERPFKGKFQVLRIDWKEKQGKNQTLQGGRDKVEAKNVFDLVYESAGQQDWRGHFKTYRDARKKIGEVEQKAAEALVSKGEHEDALGRELVQLGTGGVAKLVRLGLPMGETGEIITQKLLEAGVYIGADVAVKLRNMAITRLKAALKEDFEFFSNPDKKLSEALAAGLRSVAKDKPLLMIFDTYEIVDYVDDWVKDLITAAGSRLLWVIAGRHNLARNGRRDGRYYTGYKDIFPYVIDYDVAQLTRENVQTYFAGMVPQRPLTDEQVVTLSQVTLGIPLVIKEAAELWQNNVAFADIVGNPPTMTSRQEIVTLMTERYMMHVKAEDKPALYALALAQGDAKLFMAMMSSANKAQAIDFEQQLTTLRANYAAVHLHGACLHDEPTAFLTAFLRQPLLRDSDLIRQMNERAQASLRAHLAELEKDMPLVEDRLADDGWIQTALTLTRILFWLKERDAWSWLIPRYVEGLAYNRDLRQGLVAIAAEWREYLTDKNRLKILQAAENSLLWFATEPEEQLLRMLGKAPAKSWLRGDGEGEWWAILDLRRGKLLHQQKRYIEAARAYEKAEAGLPEGGERLYEQLGEAMNEVTGKLIWPDGRSGAIYNADAARLLAKVVTLLPEKQEAWYRLGVMHRQGGKPKEALNAYEQAANLGQNDSSLYHAQGIAYEDLGRYEEAIAAYEQAITLDPKNDHPHKGLGDVYNDLGRYEEAIAAYGQAIALDPKNDHPHNELGNVYRNLGRYDEAIAAYEQAITLDPEYAYPQAGLAAVYRKLENTAEYEQLIKKLPPFFANESPYIRACFFSIANEPDKAIKLLEEAIATNPANRQAAHNEPDFDFIRDDPRFQALVGSG